MVEGEDQALEKHQDGETSGPAEATAKSGYRDCEDARDEEQPDQGVQEPNADERRQGVRKEFHKECSLGYEARQGNGVRVDKQG
jgi:hypothetical protein